MYNPHNLSALAYANGFTLWHYRTPDSAAEIAAAGYFNAAAAMLRSGDFIMANSTGETVESAVLVVRSNTGSAVDIESLA